MATMNVLDSSNAVVAIEKPLAPGRSAAATSRPVALSTEDLAALTQLHTDLVALAANVDGLEGLATSLNGYVDGIEALIGTTNTALTTVQGYVDGLETLNGAVTETAPGTDTASSGLNGRLQRIAQRITSLIALVPASLGAKTAAGSFSVTTATDDATIALTGAVTETAPASDTASSGLNGRLQRVAQRLTTLLGAGATTIAKAEDTASADADVGVPAMAVRKATPANTSGADGDYEMLQMSAGRLWISALLEAGSSLIGRAVADASAATGGIASTARMPSAAATTNATNVKTSAGRIYSICGKNNAAYDVFLVLYDSALNPPVPGATPIRRKVVCPAGQAFVYDFPLGITFATGIGYAFTKLVADADTTALVAADITAFNLDYV